jgi:hypothetical protein
MHDQTPAGAVHVQSRPDGVLLYLIAMPPEALPPVCVRDLAAAWDAARAAALDSRWGTTRLFRFRRADGSSLDLVLSDADACCWAGAVDGTVGMNHSYGLSLCLRLLALIDLLTHAPWAGRLVALGRDGAAIEPVLMRAAATAPLTSEARFDECRLRARVGMASACIAAEASA